LPRFRVFFFFAFWPNWVKEGQERSFWVTEYSKIIIKYPHWLRTFCRYTKDEKLTLLIFRCNKRFLALPWFSVKNLIHTTSEVGRIDFVMFSWIYGKYMYYILQYCDVCICILWSEHFFLNYIQWNKIVYNNGGTYSIRTKRYLYFVQVLLRKKIIVSLQHMR
jgi:hypothetical protein